MDLPSNTVVRLNVLMCVWMVQVLDRSGTQKDLENVSYEKFHSGHGVPGAQGREKDVSVFVH